MPRSMKLFLAPLLVLALIGCTSPPSKPASASAQPNEPIVRPPREPIAANLLNDAPLFAGPRDKAPLCTATAGALQLLRFSAGRYAVQLESRDACLPATAKTREGWIDARHIDYIDTVFEPALARVRETDELRIDIAYAGNKIFCDAGVCKITQPLYGKARCYANPEVAKKLLIASHALNARDATFKLVVLDCYRPIDVQIDMFELVSDPVWVARPAPPRYGGHNRGVAIDLTIEHNGKPLDMGSAFDLFSDVSNYDASKVSAAQHANRTLLRDTMIAVGFRPYDAEWWHFSLPIDTRAMNFPL